MRWFCERLPAETECNVIYNLSKLIRQKKYGLYFSFNDGGFTVTELVLALAMMMMVMAAMISLLISLGRAYTAQNAAAGVQQVTRTGIDIMTRSIRMAGLNPLDKEHIGIMEASAHKFRFQQDRNGNGEIELGQDEDIAYLLNGNRQLIRQKDGNTRSNRSLIDNVKDLTFKYFDKDGEETNVLDEIYTVEISLTVREPAGKGKFLCRTYATRVICRNQGL